MIPQQVEDDYEVRELVGKGAFSKVYSAIHKFSHIPVALKVTELNQSPDYDAEPQVLALKGRPPGVPELISYTVYPSCSVTVMELLGESLFSLLRQRRSPLSLDCVVKGLFDALKVLKWLHRKGFVHRDVKPDNLVRGLGATCHQTYLIDYTECRPFTDSTAFDTCVGSPYFTSLNVLKGGSEGPKDDIEGLMYSMVYLLLGKLPWTEIVEGDMEVFRTMVRKKMEITSPSTLCKACPCEFESIFRHIRTISGSCLPDYHLLFTYIKSLAKRITLDIKPVLRLQHHKMKKRGSFCAASIETVKPATRSNSLHHFRGRALLSPGDAGGGKGTEESCDTQESALNAQGIPTLVTKKLPGFTSRVIQELVKRRLLNRSSPI